MDENLGGKFAFIVTFLGIFVILVSAMPTEFYASSYRGVTVPDELDALDVPVYDYTTLNITYDGSGYWQEDFGFDGGTDFRAISYNTTNTHGVDACVFFIEWDSFPWKAYGLDFWLEDVNEGATLYFPQLDEIYDETGALLFSMKTQDSGQLKFICAYVWDEETYETPTPAFENDGVIIYIGLTWEQQMSTMSAWNIVGMILFFQMPQIHPLFNLMFALPIWACIVYTIYRLILLAIPFVG